MNNDSLITVFTPVYNRAYIIAKCYESLKRQTFKDFEWLIYDDGSTDDIEEVVNNFIKEGLVKIRYYKYKNRGKHVAINRGSELAKGELFFIVDSDDYLTDNALELVFNAWNSIKKSERSLFVGVGGKRYLVNRENNNFNFTDKYYDADAIKFNLIDNNMQDKAEVYVTKVLRMYKFPEFEGENFMTEAVVWYKMAQDGYKIRWFDEDIYVCEYLDDGLTANFYKRRLNSINSTCESYNLLSTYNLPIKYKIRYKINYYRYGLNKFSIKKLNRSLYEKKFSYISCVLGYLMYIKDKKNNK